jgi:putative phosphoesterase
MVMQVAVLSDTHAPRSWKGCPTEIAARLADVQLILHAGDVCTPDVLDELRCYAPVRVVRGNNDGDDIAAWGAPDVDEFVVDGLRIAMLHDSGPSKGRLVRLRRRFPDADLVVFGHSHIPLYEEGLGLAILNPGSPTDKRRQPQGTMAIIQVEGSRLASCELVAVTRPRETSARSARQ